MTYEGQQDPIWGELNNWVRGEPEEPLNLVDNDEWVGPTATHGVWKILIADDEQEIHQATQLALNDLIFENKAVNFESVYSGEAAKQFMASHPDTALVLLDVVMERNNAGLEVAEHIRRVLHNYHVRIVLRTGQPGEAPEESVILNYDINDYKTKTELTSKRLFTSVIAALRSYRDIQTIQAHQHKLAHLNEALEKANLTLEKRVRARTARLEMIAQLGEHLNALLNVDQVLLDLVQQVEAVLGYYHVSVYLWDSVGQVWVLHVGEEATMPKTIAPHNLTSLVVQAAQAREIQRTDDLLQIAVPIIHEGQVMGVLQVQQEGHEGWDEGDINLFRFLANQVAVALKNAKLYSLAQRANQDLRRLNADKDKFFSIVAHDLKGPFLPLLGNLELMQEMAPTLKPDEVLKMSQASYRAAKRVFELLENLLAWAQLQMGRMVFQPMRLNLANLVDQTINLLEANAVAKNITLHHIVPTDLWIYADKAMTDTIIRNLTNNAVKFTLVGGRVTISAEFDDEEWVHVMVTDTGVGIPETVQSRLFRIDQNISMAGTAKEKGTGLGLIMCKEMVEKQGGRIWVESKVGIGTTVGFTVPMVKKEEVWG